MSKDVRKYGIKDSIFGFAVGDAIGVPLEFESREKLLKSPVTQMIGYGSYDVPEGTWSDDTSMTIATLDSIICNDGKLDYNDIATKFCNWINNADYTATDEVFDIGVTTKLSLIKFYTTKIDAINCGGTAFNENGNGSLMRMLPIAFYIFYKNIKNDKEIYKIVKNSSSITHAHEISIMGCFIYVKYLLFLLTDDDKYSAYKKIKDINYCNFFSSKCINTYLRIIKNDICNYSLNEINSDGYVVSTLEAVLWLVLKTEKYSDAIIGAINLGGDTDTIAAITGSIVGLLYGYKSIPKVWISKLRKKEYLEEMSNRFNALFADKS